MITAIFDLDGTLYTGHIGRGIVYHHRVHRVKRLPLAFYMATHTVLSLPGRWGLQSELEMRSLWARDMGWTVWRWTPREAAAAFAWIAEQYVQPLVRLDVLSRVREHQAEGHRVILVSGTIAPLLEAIGRQLGIEETVGTPLVVRRGRYTGRCELPVCQGPGKVTRLEAYVGGADGILWPQSYAYADSYTDLPLLERAGRAVAVYPDEQLAAHARSHKWEVMPEE